MQPQLPLIERLKKDFSELENFLVITSSQSLDSLAAGLSIYLSLLKKKKNVSIISPELPLVEHSVLVGIDKIKSETPSGKFVITLSDVLGTVDKVTHYLEDDKLNIVVHPLPDGKPFSKEKVSFGSEGTDADLIIVVGIHDLNELKHLYTQNINLYSKTPILSIGTEIVNQGIKQEIFVRRESSSLSEVTALFVNKLGLPMDEDIAENLFLGITQATKNFQLPGTSADAFEAAGYCLRCGAKRSVIAKQMVNETKVEEKNNSYVPQRPSYPTQTSASGKQDGPIPEKFNEEKEETELTDEEMDWLTPPKIYKSSK